MEDNCRQIRGRPNTEPVDADALSARRRSRGVLRAGSLSVVARLIALAVSFGTVPVVAANLGVERYGVFGTISLFVVVFSVADFGVGQGLLARYASLVSDRDEPRRVAAVSTAFAISVLLACAFIPIAIAFAIAAPWASWLSTSVAAAELQNALLIFLVILALTVPTVMGQRVWQSEQKGGQATAVSTGGAISSAIAAAVTSVFTDDLRWLMLALAAPIFLVNLVQSAIVLRRRGVRFRHATRGEGKVLLRAGSLYVVLNLAMIMSYQSQVAIVAVMLGPEQAAVLIVALRFFGLVHQLSAAFWLQLWPAFAEARARGDASWINIALRSSITRTALVGGLAIGGMVACYRPVVDLLFGQDFMPSALLIGAVAAWNLQQCIFTPVAMFLNGLQVLKFQVATSLTLGLATAPLAIWLVSFYGAAGPVLATMICHLALVILPSCWLIRRRWSDWVG